MLYLLQDTMGRIIKGQLKQPKKIKDKCIIHEAKVKDKKIIHLTEVTFKKIKYVAKLRQNQPAGSNSRKSEICNQIPAQFENNDGYHRKCYQLFTNRTNTLKESGENRNKQDSVLRRSDRNSNDGKDDTIFQPNCIFCQKFTVKSVKKRGIWHNEKLSSFKANWESVLEQATVRNDEKLL